MQLNTSKLVACLCLLEAICLVRSTCAATPEVPRASHLGRGLFRHAVFNKEETHLLTATAELAQLWDLKTGALLQQFEGHAATIHSLSFSPDEQQVLTGAGKTVVHGLDDPTVRLWDISSGSQLAVLSTVGKDLVDEIGTSSSYYVMAANFSPDGQRILAVMDSSASYPDAAVLWKLPSKEIDLVLSRISTASETMVIPEPVQFSPNGKWLSGFDKKLSQIVIWNSKTGEERYRFNASDPNEQQNRFELSRWSPSGKSILAVLNNRTIRIWDMTTGKESQRIAGHDDHIRDAHFSADESQVFTASEDRTVRLWDTQSGEQLRRWDYANPVRKVSVSSDGHCLLALMYHTGTSHVNNRWFGELRYLTSGRTIQKWELPPIWIAENQTLHAYRSAIMSPSGRLVLTSFWERGRVEVKLIETATGRIRNTY